MDVEQLSSSPAPEPEVHPPHSRVLEPWIVGVVLAGFALIAGIHIRTISIWYDEAVTLLITSGHAPLDWSYGLQQFKPTANLAKILVQLYRHDVHPPLYFWTLALWRMLFGSSLEAARVLSVLFSLGTLLLLYRVSKLVGLRWSAAPVVIYSVAGSTMLYAYDARAYAMASFLIVLTLYLARRRSKWSGLCAGACVATHYFAALIVGPLLALYCAVRWKEDRRWSLLTASSFGVICTLLVPLVIHHAGARPYQYPGFAALPTETAALVLGSLSSGLPSTWFWPLWSVAVVLAACLAILGGIRASRRKILDVPVAYTAFVLLFLIMAAVTHKSIAQMPNEYYLGIAAPLLSLLLAFGLEACVFLTPVFAVLLALAMVSAIPIRLGTDYRRLAAEIRPQCDGCAIVVGMGYGTIPACVLYEGRDMEIVLLTPGDTVDGIRQRLDGRKPIFFIPSNEPGTAEVENRFLKSYVTVPANGYFRLTTENSRLR